MPTVMSLPLTHSRIASLAALNNFRLAMTCTQYQPTVPPARRRSLHTFHPLTFSAIGLTTIEMVRLMRPRYRTEITLLLTSLLLLRQCRAGLWHITT